MVEDSGLTPVRVVIADDQRVIRDGLELMLSLVGRLEVAATAADGDEAVRAVAEHDPDVVLMDLRMPRCDGVTATRRIRAEYSRTRVVVLTTVKTHINHLFAKTGVRDRAQAVAYAYRHGLVR